MFIFVVGNFHLVDGSANVIMSQESSLTGRGLEGSLCWGTVSARKLGLSALLL